MENNAERRPGIGPNKPAYLVASNVTKDGETYYAKVTEPRQNAVYGKEPAAPVVKVVRPRQNAGSENVIYFLEPETVKITKK